jgi:hypothetical protein
MPSLTTLLLFLASGTLLMGGQKKAVCTTEDAVRAETEASTLQTWTDVYNSYKKFGQCDDGAIGEGYSDSVARLLSEDWRNFGQLNQLTSRDKEFETFVLRHIDELMSPAQQLKIRDNASTHCSVHTTHLCNEIIARTKESSPH